MKKAERKIGRFQVMALLQAARYYILMKDFEKALSFGLNRAIFYAWAKRTLRTAPSKVRRQKTREEVLEGKKETREEKTFFLGNEEAYLSENGWFKIGNQEQKPTDFEKEIIDKIADTMQFEEAWKAAIDYLNKFDKETLLDQRKFFEEVYKPVRDKFPNI
ncbi:MAG: hypothetical protein QXS21_01690 [Thermoproteota archaeon]|nr:hypothetical protein [Candidatus Brockarchaeota archaeon]MBO3768583.1 hypothetical protein [Candidatus Brockarchaeota archaeon]MBO3800755.1 hypothetical protein [Candidatus Brockarchaeota archaeon]